MVGRWRAILALSGVRRGWRVAAFVSIGVALGAAGVVARVSNAVSYLSGSPETCMNCHVMTDAYLSWQHGSHAKVAVCIDCHIPHTNPVAALAFKGSDGMKHSYVFTFRLEPQVLRLSRPAVPVVQGNCLRCHGQVMSMVRLAGVGERRCWDCHDNIHGAVQSLSASPAVARPRLPDAGLPGIQR